MQHTIACMPQARGCLRIVGQGPGTPTAPCSRTLAHPRLQPGKPPVAGVELGVSEEEMTHAYVRMPGSAVAAPPRPNPNNPNPNPNPNPNSNP